MELKDFEALLHVCIIFNFLYSTENFSNRISSFFSSPFRGISFNQFDNLSRYVQALRDNKALIDSSLDTDSLKKRIEKNYVELSRQVSLLMHGSSINSFDFEYNSIFKGCYFYSGFYALFLLLVASLHSYMHLPNYYNALFVSNIISSLVLVAAFLASFIKISHLRFPLILLMFSLNVGVYTLVYHLNNRIDFLPNQNCATLFGLVIVFATPLLHFIRIALQTLVIYFGGIKMMKRYKKIFHKIEKSMTEINLAKEVLAKYKKLDK
jgi:hypothetical protein